jgi:hypothetical protein
MWWMESTTSAVNFFYLPKIGINIHSFPLSLEGLCRNAENSLFVILSEAKNLINSGCYEFEILRFTPQNDITTQSLTGEGRGEGIRG